MFKVLIGRAELGGNIQAQKSLVDRAKSDLEVQLNDKSVEQICAVSVYESDHEVQLIAVVKVTAQPVTKKK